MKKITILISFVLFAVVAKAQIQPVDSLYIWVHFTDEKILLDFPDCYFNYRTEIPVLPPVAGFRKMAIAVPDLPNNETIRKMVLTELSKTNKLTTKANQLNFLGQISIMLYYSGNDRLWLTHEIQQQFEKLLTNSLVTKEAKLVKRWIAL